jgi:hypothetical protein
LFVPYCGRYIIAEKNERFVLASAADVVIGVVEDEKLFLFAEKELCVCVFQS